ncbi:MAG: hypothetical protein Q3990_05195, partial [Desulfovibrionaceae bacterium]|nr:hypothetical protein [Desulfovibrionaceae bacterium]
MLFKNTSCLATLVLSIPLVLPAVCSASSEYVLDARESGNQEVFNVHEQAEYSRVVMGQAISEDGTETDLKASDNSATFNSGVNVQGEVVGGRACYNISSDLTNITAEAGNNTIIFATGSSFKSAEDVSTARSVYGGIVSLGDNTTITVNGTFTASKNRVDIQSGAVFGAAGKITIVGGSSSNEGPGSCNVFSQENTVTINGFAFEGSAEAPLEFALISAGVSFTNNGKAVAGSEYDGSESYKDLGNTLTITSLDNAVIGRVSAAEATSAAGNAFAIYNSGTLDFGDNVQADAVYGAYAKGQSATATHNTLSLSGGQAELVTGAYAEGNSASASHNTGRLRNVQLRAFDSDAVATAGEFSGGKAAASSGYGMAIVLNNRFTIEGGSFTRAFGGQAVSVYGSSTVTAESNILALTNVTAGQNSSSDSSSASSSAQQYDGCLYGGYASNATADTGAEIDPSGRKATAGSNRLYLSGGSYQGNIYGGYARSGSEAEAGRNWVYVNYALQNADDYNSFAPSESEISFEALYGGYAEGLTASASGNEIRLYKVTGAGPEIYGGRATASGNATASHNNVVMQDGSYDGRLYGGYAEGGGQTEDASANAISMTGVTAIGAEIYGGRAVFTAYYGLARASDNSLDLYGGSYDGRLYGGYAEAANGSAMAEGNNINLRLADGLSPNFNGTAVLCGGFASGSEYSSSSGNKLNFYEVKGMQAGNIENFSLLYYKYQTMQAGDHILTLTGGQATSIPDATVEVSLVSLFGQDGTGEFLADDEVVLLENANTINIGEKYNDGVQIAGVTGVSLEYTDLVLKQTEDKTKIILTRIGDDADAESDTPEDDPVDTDTDPDPGEDPSGDDDTTDGDTGTDTGGDTGGGGTTGGDTGSDGDTAGGDTSSDTGTDTATDADADKKDDSSTKDNAGKEDDSSAKDDSG